MTKTMIIISELVDSTIREGQMDTTFLIFRTIDELATYIEQTPVRAESLFFTRETIPHTNTSLNFLASMLTNPFLRVDHVVYITEINSKEIPSVKYIVAEKAFENWEIVQGYLTREYVNGIVTGSLRQEGINAKRKAVYRVPRSSYVQDRIKNKEALEELYMDDDKYLGDVPPVTVPQGVLVDKVNVCELIHVVGADNDERTVFCFLLAQYMAFSGKTLVVEKDTEYHRMTEFVTKSGVECLTIRIAEMLSDPVSMLEKIRRSPASLICVIAIDRLEYSYPFICSVLYNNLSSDIDYFVVEDDFSEAPVSGQYTVVVPTTIIGALSMSESLDGNYVHLVNFVGVDLKTLPETRIVNGTAFSTLLSDILEMPVKNVPILTVSSLKIGGNIGYDLRSIVKR